MLCVGPKTKVVTREPGLVSSLVTHLLSSPFARVPREVFVPGGYFSKYMAVTPVSSPQVSNCAIVGATPKDQHTGEPALRVAYDNAPGLDDRPRGLFICQQAMMYVPQPQRP